MRGLRRIPAQATQRATLRGDTVNLLFKSYSEKVYLFCRCTFYYYSITQRVRGNKRYQQWAVSKLWFIKPILWTVMFVHEIPLEKSNIHQPLGRRTNVFEITSSRHKFPEWTPERTICYNLIIYDIMKIIKAKRTRSCGYKSKRAGEAGAGIFSRFSRSYVNAFARKSRSSDRNGSFF